MKVLGKERKERIKKVDSTKRAENLMREKILGLILKHLNLKGVLGKDLSALEWEESKDQ